MSNNLTIDHINEDLVIRFTRPAIRNPLSIEVLDELRSVLIDCTAQGETAKIIFTGTNDVFASGADLNEIKRITADSAAEFALRGQALMTMISRLPQTTMAAVNGFCFGGALDLALACKRRIASPNATFAHPGLRLGIITGWGGTQRLPRLIGQANALEMFFTAEAINAERAFTVGLIDQISDDPLQSALSLTAV